MSLFCFLPCLSLFMSIIFEACILAGSNGFPWESDRKVVGDLCHPLRLSNGPVHERLAGDWSANRTREVRASGQNCCPSRLGVLSWDRGLSSKRCGEMDGPVSPSITTPAGRSCPPRETGTQMFSDGRHCRLRCPQCG